MINNFFINRFPKWFYRKPSFMLLGVQKGGTTTLYHLLNKHPKITSSQKEIYFFSDDDLYLNGYNWYHQTFFKTGLPFSSKKVFDATPAYWSVEGVEERLYNYNPNLKFLLILRDPVKRAYSAWNMYMQFRSDLPERLQRKALSIHAQQIIKFFIKKTPAPSFKETVDYELSNMDKILQPSILRTGIYVKNLERYFEYFDPSQFKIITDKELQLEPQKVLNEIFDFLDLSTHTFPDAMLFKKYHKRKYQSAISNDVEKQLRLFYKPYDEALSKLLKKDFYWMQ